MKNSSPSTSSRNCRPTKGETCSELQEEPGDVADQGVLDVPFDGFVAEAEKIEEVGVL
jgi:hypothetical protein